MREQRERSSLLRTSGVLGIAMVVARGANFGVITALAHAAGVRAVGLYGIATLIASLASLAGSLGFAVFLTREKSAGGVTLEDVSAVHKARLMVMVGIGTGFFLLSNVFLGGAVAPGFALFGAAVLLDQWNETAWALVRGTRRAHVEALVNGTTYLGLLALVGGFAALGTLSFNRAGLFAFLVAIIRAASAIAFSRLQFAAKARDGFRFIAQNLRRACPYLAADVLGLAYLRGDTLVLTAFVATTQVGFYVAAATIVAPVVQVGAAMSVGAIATAARRSARGEPPEREVATFFIRSGLLVATLVCAGSPLVVLVELPEGRSTVLSLACILALFVPLRFINFGMSSLLLAEGRAVSRLWVVGASVVANVALNFALDPWYGATGAAIATVITEIGITVAFAIAIGNSELARRAAGIAATVLLASTGPALAVTGLGANLSSAVAAAVFAGCLFVTVARAPGLGAAGRPLLSR